MSKYNGPFSVDYRQPLILDVSDPRNKNINKYISKLAKETVLKKTNESIILSSSYSDGDNPEDPVIASILPSYQVVIGETESYVTTLSFTPNDAFSGTVTYSIYGEEDFTGLEFNSTTGVISGTTTTAIPTTIYTVTARDNFEAVAYADIKITVLIKAAISPEAQAIYGEVDTYLATTAFTPNDRFIGSVTYLLSGGTLPVGLSFDTSTGVISGTPISSLEETEFIVTASGVDMFGTSVSANAYIDLAVLIKPEITPATQTLIGAEGEEITPTTAFIPNSRFVGTVTYGLSGGILPAGLLFDTSTGVISGMPLSPLEETEFIVTANGVDIYDQSVSATATIDVTILDTPAITPETQTIMTLVDILITPTIAYTPNAVFNGTVTYTLVPPAGRSLPTGLSFDTATGVISGTPTTTLGTTNFTVQADDLFGHTANATITITVTSTVLVVTPEIINTPGLTDSASITLLNVGTISITDSIITPSESDAVLLENINILSATASDNIAVNQETDSAIAESLSVLDASVSDNISYTNINDSALSTFLSLPSDIVTSGLVVCLDAANSQSYPGSGTNWFDVSYNSNHASLVNGPTYSSLDSGSIVFDGSNDYANFSSRILTNSITEISCFMWIYPKTDGIILSVLGQSAINTSYHHSAIEIGSTGQLRIGLWNGTSISSVTSSLTLNTWNNVGFTYSGTTLTGYLNNTSIGTASFTWSKPSDIFFGIMATDITNMGTSAYGDGNVSTLYVYNKALTAPEIQTNFDAIKGRYGL